MHNNDVNRQFIIKLTRRPGLPLSDPFQNRYHVPKDGRLTNTRPFSGQRSLITGHLAFWLIEIKK